MINDKEYTVYKHTAPNGKVYIGITRQKLNMRWRNGDGYKYNKHFYRAIKNYEWKNFKHDIIADGLTKEQACAKEIELIAKYDATNPKHGYNSSTGGYVYFLECGGRYKIGFSKNVERRMRQLDTRPFKINLVAKSKYLSDAYDWEQGLHDACSDSRIDGEWYEFSVSDLRWLKEAIRKLKEGYHHE